MSLRSSDDQLLGPMANGSNECRPPKPPLLPARNAVQLTREDLISVLDHFSQRLEVHFSTTPVRLVVHGGACILLHPVLHMESRQQKMNLSQLPYRQTTRDVDYIHRSFVAEMAYLGVQGAEAKLKRCIEETAKAFGLGLDWMYNETDIELPMVTTPNGVQSDPIYLDSIRPDNVNNNTIYRSANGILSLIAVNPFWAVALKLQRFSQLDASDICVILRAGSVLSGTSWSTETLRDWVLRSCQPMRYHKYDPGRRKQLEDRMSYIIENLTKWEKNEGGVVLDDAAAARQRPAPDSDSTRSRNMAPGPPIREPQRCQDLKTSSSSLSQARSSRGSRPSIHGLFGTNLQFGHQLTSPACSDSPLADQPPEAEEIDFFPPPADSEYDASVSSAPGSPTSPFSFAEEESAFDVDEEQDRFGLGGVMKWDGLVIMPARTSSQMHIHKMSALAPSYR